MLNPHAKLPLSAAVIGSLNSSPSAPCPHTHTQSELASLFSPLYRSLSLSFISFSLLCIVVNSLVSELNVRVKDYMAKLALSIDAAIAADKVCQWRRSRRRGQRGGEGGARLLPIFECIKRNHCAANKCRPHTNTQTQRQRRRGEGGSVWAEVKLILAYIGQHAKCKVWHDSKAAAASCVAHKMHCV